MQTQDKEKPVEKIVGNRGFQATSDFEASQNLIGAFSILLDWDQRINPQNYELISNQDQND